MTHRTGAGGLLVLAAGIVLATTTPGQPQPPPTGAKIQPKLEAVAETRLLMEGLAQANMRGLERLLTQRPTEQQAWVFARGQALLIAETGNLLMLRPPRNQGQPQWFQYATDLRQTATQLAQAVAQRDYDRSRKGLLQLAVVCNRCHQTFRVPVLIEPFSDKQGGPKVEARNEYTKPGPI